jgi:predicted transcriptional regulator
MVAGWMRRTSPTTARRYGMFSICERRDFSLLLFLAVKGSAFHEQKNIPNKRIILEAVINTNLGDEILEFLDKLDKARVPISDSVLVKAIRNARCGSRIMSLLLERRRKDTKVTADVMDDLEISFKESRSDRDEMMCTLLDKCTNEMISQPRILEIVIQLRQI